jgi:hypothetical protein
MHIVYKAVPQRQTMLAVGGPQRFGRSAAPHLRKEIVPILGRARMWGCLHLSLVREVWPLCSSGWNFVSFGSIVRSTIT